MVSHERHADDVVPGADAALSEDALLDLLDALVEARGRVAAADALGVNFRTLATCCDTRRVSRRMRRALVDFRDAGGVSGVGGPGDIAAAERQRLAERVASLETENAGLRELVAERERQLEQMAGRVAELEAARRDAGDGVAVGVEENGGGPGAQDWRPPRRQPGMPDAGIVTLEQQPDEAHAFGPAAPLVAQWRELVNSGGQTFSRVDRAQATVRRWQLEAEMLGEFHLTLPPETFPLDEASRADQVRWRNDALAEARRELGRARRARWLRRVATLGLWRK